MAVYATVLINIHNESIYELYTAGWLNVWENHAGELLAVDDSPILIEGKWPAYRTVIMRFPSEADFHAWYESPGYQGLLRHRHAASKASFALIREFKLPTQPSGEQWEASNSP